MVEWHRLTAYVERQFRCACGAHLRFCKAASHQVGVCASWCFVCEKSCKLPPLLTSMPLHGDDYELNSKLNFAMIGYTELVSYGVSEKHSGGKHHQNETVYN